MNTHTYWFASFLAVKCAFSIWDGILIGFNLQFLSKYNGLPFIFGLIFLRMALQVFICVP